MTWRRDKSSTSRHLISVLVPLCLKFREAAKGSSASNNPTELSCHVAGFPPSPCLELVCPGRWASNQELGMSGRPVIHRAEIGARQDDLDLALANSDDQPVLRVVQDSASRFSRARAELRHGGRIIYLTT